MEELASILMHSRTQAHVFHLGVNGPGAFAAHKALQKYYESIVDLLDGLVESYQGKYGLIGGIALQPAKKTANIIDFLQEWNISKKVERSFKAMIGNSN